VVAQTAVENHIARRRERSHRLLHGNRLVESKHRARSMHLKSPLRAAHDHQRYCTRARTFLLQFTKKLSRAIQVTVNNQSIDLRLSEPRQSSLRFALDGNIDV